MRLTTATVRRHAAIATAALLLGAVAGCDAVPGADGSAAAAPPAPELVEDGVLTVCTDIPYRPFEFMRGGKPAGFDVDLVQKVADRLGAELQVVDTGFDDIASGEALNKGVCDVAASAMTITGERARVLNFSSPYFEASQALVVPRRSGIDSLDDLAGEKIGVQGGTTGELYVTDHAPTDAEVVPFDDAAAMGAAMAQGVVAAAVYDNTVVGAVVKANPRLAVAAQFDTGEQYGMAVRANGNVELLRVINDVLATLKADGGYDDIYATWFGRAGS